MYYNTEDSNDRTGDQRCRGCDGHYKDMGLPVSVK